MLKNFQVLTEEKHIGKVYWWLVRVTLVVAFGFLPQNFGKWWGPTNTTLSFYECRFSGGDPQTLPCAK